MRVALVTNVPAHYRVPVFEELARTFELDVFFTGSRRTWYWPTAHSRDVGQLTAQRETSARRLAKALADGRYDCVVAGLVGRATLVAAVGTALRLRIPLVLWTGIWDHPRTMAHRLSRPLTRMLYRRADALAVYGPHVARHVKAESGRCTNVFEVPQAVDNHYFRRRASEGDRVGTRARFDLADGPVACYAGRLEEGKGLDVLLRALTKVATPEQLLIVGEGGLRADLDELACDLRISDRVRFAEYVEQSTLPDVLGAVDFLVLPSVTTKRFREPWGLVVNEAMSSGLPVIASDAVGAAAAGLVVDDVTGLIVPEGDAAALATAMERLAADPGLRSRLATAAGQHVFRWSFEAAAAGLADAIRAAAAGMEAADAGLAHA